MRWRRQWLQISMAWGALSVLSIGVRAQTNENANESPVSPSASQAQPQTQQKSVVPFEDFGSPLIQVVLDGVPLRLIVDTGAPTTFITETARKKLSSQTQPDKPNGDIYSAGTLQIGDWKTEQIKIRILKDADAAKFEEHNDGLLGLDVLRKAALQWDYAAKKLTLLFPGNLNESPYGSNGVILKLQEKSYPLENTELTAYRCYVDIGAEDAAGALYQFPIELDTGSWITVLPSSVAPNARRLSILHNYYGIGIMGHFRTTVSRLPYLAFGKLSVPAPVIEIVPAHHAFGEGLLGMDMLRHFHVTMDFPAHKLYLETDSNYMEIKSWAGLGFNAIWKGKDYVVEGVYQPSAAATAGVKADDVLLAVDQIHVTLTSRKQLQEYKETWTEGRVVVLKIKRKGESKPRIFRITMKKLV